ncbi:Large neutral amino acids transporter small subunit 2 [Schistosoma japonicum]|uniref:Large neutral amino acids transporter small subunit 2 n=1 Tax=Schistosoma japonicum TaxID=6182 RepID=A0A4Z2DDZ0_SCHJA|nr:Large neutral amino acids transporter small subunit 2 [Schistosoma japonicum]
MKKCKTSNNEITDSNVNDKIAMKRQLGLWSGVSITVGSIIGSGVFVTPKGVLENSEQSPGISIIIWILSGIISLLGSLCYAELGTTITDSGGDYVYIKKAFGNLPAFLQLWVNLIVIRPTTIAITAFGFAYYILYPIYPNCNPPHILILSLSILSITFLTWINVMKVKWATTIQNVFTTAKLLALIGIILSGLYVVCQGKLENFQDFWQPIQPLHPSRLALALYSGLFAYAGWNSLNIVTEELQNPEKNLPRSIYISITLVTIVYVLTNMAYFTVLLPYEIIQSNAVAVTFADRLFGQFSWFMSIFISLSCFGGLNGLLFTSGRLNFVAAREGQLPALLATIHSERLTPIPAILLNCFLSLIMLIIPDLFTLINYMSFVKWLSIAASILAMLHLRHSRPDITRPLRLPLIIPIVFLFVCAFLLILPIFHKPKELLTGMGIVLSGIPIYLIGMTWNRKPDVYKQKYNYLTIQCQKLLHVIYPT